MVSYNEQRFILAQIQEIYHYLQKHRGEDPDLVVMQWIDRYAADYRKSWKQEHPIH